MKHQLMELPFNLQALEPYISKETLQYHHGKHHATYVNNLNNLIENTKYEAMSLEEIIKTSKGGIFNNAAQVYNHNVYFQGMCSKNTEPSEELRKKIEEEFGSMDAFKQAFLNAAVTLFGSGWVWLSVTPLGSLIIEQMSNANNPLLGKNTPLMTCDVWEHAYYIGYRNARATYLENWWELINWNFVSANYKNV
ncbi:superoxide dismutase [bacterium]|nr:superoxide dismutase [bacterium]MBU1957701.1 superoxide dismutase [bacterium]